ncbi:pentatricopeptide repeat-containing protein [Dorcoceras hygrometricum]|uniref:Pentatricopeptide repeat-containing protein n=1 Tax=Dorcoceras hygrometricum TaxID=472368 RepID=A0A2Z7AX85_9LAMI|nr:pentatricopeptide repeat-containing protein [Dorcoceras hygrometricum]
MLGRDKRGSWRIQHAREQHHRAPIIAHKSATRRPPCEKEAATSCAIVREIVATSRPPGGRYSRPCAASVHVPRAHMRTAAVDCQSGPRPDSIFLQSACTRKLMDLPRTESPRRGDRNKSDHEAGGGPPGNRNLTPVDFESSTTMHRLLHASGSHPIPPPDDPKTNQYNQDLGLIHSTNGNHLESPNEGSSIDHQVTIYLHAQSITMFPTNETRDDVSVTQGELLVLVLKFEVAAGRCCA